MLLESQQSIHAELSWLKARLDLAEVDLTSNLFEEISLFDDDDIQVDSNDLSEIRKVFEGSAPNEIVPILVTVDSNSTAKLILLINTLINQYFIEKKVEDAVVTPEISGLDSSIASILAANTVKNDPLNKVKAIIRGTLVKEHEIFSYEEVQLELLLKVILQMEDHYKNLIIGLTLQEIRTLL